MNEPLHDHLGQKLDEASYLLGFARSIIESLTGGLPPSDATLMCFKREYDAHFLPVREGAQIKSRRPDRPACEGTQATQGDQENCRAANLNSPSRT